MRPRSVCCCTEPVCDASRSSRPIAEFKPSDLRHARVGQSSSSPLTPARTSARRRDAISTCTADNRAAACSSLVCCSLGIREWDMAALPKLPRAYTCGGIHFALPFVLRPSLRFRSFFLFLQQPIYFLRKRQ